MCEWGDDVLVWVKIPADLSSTGKVKWKDAKIDRCLAPIVKAFQGGGIDMRGSCCGHGKFLGDIDLEDGRMLLILNEKQARAYMTRVSKEDLVGGLRALIEVLKEEKGETQKSPRQD